MFIFLSHQPFYYSSPDVFLLVFAWLAILTKLHYLTLVPVELRPLFCSGFFPDRFF